MSEIILFTSSYPINMSVLFLVFNRLDTHQTGFQAIRQAKLQRLYIAADGVSANKEGENRKNLSRS